MHKAMRHSVLSSIVANVSPCDTNLSCDSTTAWCSWVRVPVNPDVLHLDVPCGLMYHTLVVVPITIAVTSLGSVHIIRMIMYAHTYP